MSCGKCGSNEGSVLPAVPIFALPNVVLFPRAILPLHIFEQRYKVMTAEAVAGDRQIAMALLKPGWEKDYHSRPEIEPIVCIGAILTHEKLADGEFNFLLQGHSRARIVRECDGGPYRRADLELLIEPPVMEIDLANERHRFSQMFGSSELSETSLGQQFARLLNGPIPTAEIADLAAFNFIEDVALKQALLAELDVRRRVARILSLLDHLAPAFRPARRGAAPRPSSN
jgi:uncharacterized protein